MLVAAHYRDSLFRLFPLYHSIPGTQAFSTEPGDGGAPLKAKKSVATPPDFLYNFFT